MSSADKKNFTSSFQFWCLFRIFSCLSALSRTSSIPLNRNGKSGYPCLIPHVRRKAFSFYIKHDISCWLSCMAFIILRYISSIPNLLRGFMLKECWISSNFIFWIFEIIGICHSVIVVYHYWFAYDETSLHLWNNSDLIIVYYPFNVLFNSVCWFFWKYFCNYVHWGYWLIICFFMWNESNARFIK